MRDKLIYYTDILYIKCVEVLIKDDSRQTVGKFIKEVAATRSLLLPNSPKVLLI